MPDETPAVPSQETIDKYLLILSNKASAENTAAALKATIEFDSNVPNGYITGVVLQHYEQMVQAFTAAKENLETAFPTLTGTVSTPTA
jgi:hypothetical protein